MMFKRLDTSNTETTVNIIIEGQSVTVPEGETVAAAMLVFSDGHTRTTPVSGAPRAPLCLMGVCYECLMTINGKPNQQACLTKVEEGMLIQRQRGVGKLP